MSYRNSRGRFRSELDHGYRSGGKHSRPLERPLETFRRASYTRETTSGSDFSRFERNESFDSRYSPDRRDRYRSSYGDEYKISYRNNSADRYVESYRNRCDSFGERDDLVREDFHRRKNVGYDKPSRSRGRARGRAGFTRGVKRYTEQPYQSGMPVKKRKLSDTEINRNFKKYPQPARFRNEQQKHWKNIYGDSNWMAFSCSFCKFRSFDENSFKNHLESDWHREVLDHIKERKKFEKTMIKFLHESVVDKGKKIEACKLQSYQSEEITMATYILEGVTPQDHMEEVKSLHCNACNMDIPYLHPSVQIHIKSPKHLKNREEYRMHIKKQSVHIASNILKNPTVSARYELYLKGENPFDTQDDQVDVTVESDENAESEESDSEETAAMPTDE